MPDFIASNTAENTGSSDLVLTKPAGTADNDYMVVVIAGDLLVVNTLAGWTLIDSRSDVDDGKIYIFEKIADGEPASYTFDVVSATNSTGFIASFDSAEIDVQSAIVEDDTGTITVPSITATEVGILLFMAYNTDGFTWTPPSGMTERVDFGTNFRILLATVAQASGATGDKSAVESSPFSVGQAIMIELKDLAVPSSDNTDSLFFATNF